MIAWTAPWSLSRPDPVVDLANHPLDVFAEVSAAEALNHRHAGDGEALLDFASRRSWRNADLLLRRARRAIAVGALADAVDPVDALLRLDSQGETRGTLFPLLIALTKDDGARDELVARLQLHPIWRVSFLQTLGWQGDPDSARLVLRGLVPLSETEAGPVLEHDVALGLYAQALDDERRLWPADRLRPLSMWTISRGGGVMAEVLQAPAAATLRINYDGLGAGPFPRRLVTLPPGRFQVLARHEHPGLAGVELSVRCANDGRLLGVEPIVDAPGAELTKVPITVPDQGCAGQWIGFESPGRQRLVETTDVYSDLRVTAGPDS